MRRGAGSYKAALALIPDESARKFEVYVNLLGLLRRLRRCNMVCFRYFRLALRLRPDDDRCARDAGRGGAGRGG